MSIKDKLLASLSIILVIALLFGLGSGILNADRSLPENPIGEDPQLLSAETISGSGKLLSDTQEKNEHSEGESSQEQEDPPEPSEEPESSPEPEPSQNPDTDEGEVDSSLPPEESEEDGDKNHGDATPDDGGGSTDSGEDGDGTGGNGAGGDNAPRIATDLRSQQITLSELPDGILRFYAYPVGEGENLTVKAVLQNSKTPKNGKTLQSQDQINYRAELVLNETSTITLYLKENGENIAYVRYRISYETDKADEDHPEVGDNPPTIVTNLDGFTGEMKTQDFVFWVRATTNPGGDTIYSNQIEVWLDGKLVTKSTGDARPEYDLHFEPPNRGDTRTYKVKVRAWDGKGNSTMKVYSIVYRTVSEGDINGEVQVILDATTVGLGGNLDSETLTIVQGETAASVVIRFLENCSYEAEYSGSEKTGCYIRRLSRGDMCKKAKVPDALWELIQRDGIQTNNNKDRDSLGEFDYTMGSGWVYSINGTVYPSRGLSDQTVSDGDKIYIRFTLAYGKDVGGSGEGKGKLDSYCGAWINGGYQAKDHEKYFKETKRVEPTATQDGYVEYTCERCQAVKREVLPALGGETTTPTPDPTPELTPDPTPEPTPDPTPEPTPEQPPEQEETHENRKKNSDSAVVLGAVYDDGFGHRRVTRP